MRLPDGLFCLCVLPLLAGLVCAQQDESDADAQTSLKGCRIIRMTLNARERMRASGDVPSDDEFTTARKGCDRLEKAMSSSDPGTIKVAAASLRPLLARLGMPPTSPLEQLSALEEATTGAKGETLFDALPDLAKRAFNAGKTDKAKSYAKQLLQMALRYPRDDGNAIFYGNFVLGRIAVQEGNLTQAGQYLLASAATHGSPVLDTFGPSMSLAKELLEKGQSTAVVIEYFALCKKFWEMNDGKLDRWTETVRSGGIPDFGANLNY